MVCTLGREGFPSELASCLRSSEDDQDSNMVHTSCEHLDQLLALELYTVLNTALPRSELTQCLFQGEMVVEYIAERMVLRYECQDPATETPKQLNGRA